MDDADVKVKRALPLLSNGGRLAFGGSFAEIPLYEPYDEPSELTAKRARLEAAGRRARGEGKIVQLSFFEEAA